MGESSSHYLILGNTAHSVLDLGDFGHDLLLHLLRLQLLVREEGYAQLKIERFSNV